ncbi:putative exonuclease I [Candidatus Zinderia insecticola CARI]|uniref:Exodeoxyribonuclease I n=1 Tax=Zinderia insecticola (strain CARI) TaxID=871271 RepID=E0TIM0_ZINIC|nr:putative exonuclease I [Candidatus Zinderia insecticola CARI]
MSKYNFLWYDYETFNLNKNFTFPSQFASIRTNLNLKIIKKYKIIYCKPDGSFMPCPKSILLNKILPQYCEKYGIKEYKFANKINKIMLKPYTINIGYNNINFDDIITRFLFWRNLLNPYEREWKNKCSTYDFFNIIKIIYFINYNSLKWFKKKNKKISFKLSDISKINGYLNKFFHNALFDVNATLFCAKIIKKKNFKLFYKFIKLRNKKNIIKNILFKKKVFLYLSNKYPFFEKEIFILLPLFIDNKNKNKLICLNINSNFNNFFDFKKKYNFKKINNYIKIININKYPIIFFNIKKILKKINFKINFNLIKKNITKINNNIKLILNIYKKFNYNYKYKKILNINFDLYNNFFISLNDKYNIKIIKKLNINKIHNKKFYFYNNNIKILCFFYKLKKYKKYISNFEKKIWIKYCKINLLKNYNNELNFFEKLFYIKKKYLKCSNKYKKKILYFLINYARKINPFNNDINDW